MNEQPYKIEKQDHCIQVEFSKGLEITPELIINAMDHENALYDIKGRHDLWDFRGCRPSPNFGYDAMSRVVLHILSHTDGNWSEKTALLVDDTIQYGLSRMFQILVDEYPTRIEIFQNEADARAWISRKPDIEGNAQ